MTTLNKDNWKVESEIIKAMSEYQEKFNIMDDVGDKTPKPFYHFHEWTGWRFYLKAIRYGDWLSIKQHIKNTYFAD